MTDSPALPPASTPAPSEDPTPRTGERLTGVERVLARSDATIARSQRLRVAAEEAQRERAERTEAVDALVERLGRIEDRATAAEERADAIEREAHAARADAGAARREVREARQELLALGGRVTGHGTRLDALEGAVVRIASLDQHVTGLRRHQYGAGGLAATVVAIVLALLARYLGLPAPL